MTDPTKLTLEERDREKESLTRDNISAYKILEETTKAHDELEAKLKIADEEILALKAEVERLQELRITRNTERMEMANKISDLTEKLKLAESDRDDFQTQAGAYKKQLFLSQVAEGKMREALIECLPSCDCCDNRAFWSDFRHGSEENYCTEHAPESFKNYQSLLRYPKANQALLSAPSSNVQVYEVLKEAKEALMKDNITMAIVCADLKRRNPGQEQNIRELQEAGKQNGEALKSIGEVV